LGQRYDVIIRADQSDTADNFWIRAVPQTSCSSTNSMEHDILGIVYYGTSPSTPDTTGYNKTDSCDDMSSTDLVPYVSKTVDSAAIWTEEEPVTIGAAPTNSNLLWWSVNGATLDMSWSNQTLLQVYDNTTSFNTSANVVQVSDADEWVYVVISTALGIAHPTHLHGHDFFVLAQGTGTYDSSVTLNLDNPVRRDVAMLAAQGYLVIAFQTDNPGVWLIHCHIGWHTDEGLAIQFVERQSEARELIDYESLSETCAAWETWQTSDGLVQEDDGI
ncbi:laccase precursor, partial [Achaetomium macrosporum]